MKKRANPKWGYVMSRDLELVSRLETPAPPATDADTERQRARLVAAIGEETLRHAPSARPRKHRTTPLRALVAVAVIGALGGGTAFALSRRGPDPRDSATIQRQYNEGRAVHVPGWRPELDAEHVVCDYRALHVEPSLLYSYASEFPLTELLTEERLVDECRARTDAVRGAAPVTAPAQLCAVTPPGERYAVPVVTFAKNDCVAAGFAQPAPSLLDDRNRLRRAESAIRAIGDCPSASEATRWVHEQVAASGAPLRIIPVEEYEGGRCWLPHVAWGRGEVRINALYSDPVAGGTTPTTHQP